MIPPPLTSRRSLAGWVRESLSLAGVRPSRRLGQSFLVDPRGVKAFLDALAIVSPSRLLEVGPGPGTLTYWAAQSLSTPVVAVEIDARLARVAASRAGHPLVAYVVGDGVEQAGRARVDTILSNTPYKETSRIIASAARNNSVTRMVLGLQKEVAERITARPGEKDYGRLTLLVARYFRVEKAGFLPRHWFHPKPEVDGLILVFYRIREWREDCFERLTACLFSSRNKKAYKIAAKCAGLEPGKTRERLGDKRVRDLTLWDVEWMIEAGACTSGKGST